MDKKIVSYSQYAMWSRCPLQWKLAYIDKLAPDDTNIHNIFGSSMHDTIQTWAEALFNRKESYAKRMDLCDILKDRMVFHFTESITEVNGQKVYVCDKNTLTEFHDDGCQILTYLQSNYKKFFDPIQWDLVGIELPLLLEVRPGLEFRGYCDLVLKHKINGVIKIIDLKTSTRGWNKWQKKDKAKTNQLLIYKKYYAEKFNIPEEYIAVEFMILKRKLWEEAQFPQPRVSKFEPSNGNVSLNRASKEFANFLDECFTEDGKYKTDSIEPTPSKSACRFCPFKTEKELCPVGIA